MTRKLFFVVLCILTAIGMKAQTYGTDVTSTRLTNPSFEKKAANTNSTAAAQTNGGTYYGWTLPNLGASYVNISIGNSSACDGQAFGIPTATDGSFYYFARHGWNTNTPTEGTLSTTTSSALPVGYYTLTFDYKGLDSWDNSHNYKGSHIKVSAVNSGGTELASAQTPDFETVNGNTAGANKFKGDANWKSQTLVFRVTTAGTVTLKFLHSMKGGVRTDVVIDNVRLVYETEAVHAAHLNLDGLIKKAEALNTVLANSDLASLITTIKGKSYTTEAAINTDANALKAYFPTEVVNLTNSDFDTNVNIGTNGANSASIIAPATAAKPYIYPVTGWEQNFTFGHTASQGNTARYGATVQDNTNNGTNSTNPPATDMFGNTEGGTLHLSSGWGDQARYKQTIASLPAGRYIIYYEANNQNDAAMAINGNYFGVSDVESGAIKGTATTYKYSDLKTYPYNQWTASATELTITKSQTNVTMNIGVIGATGGSGTGAKLWVDNVTLYYLGWDSSEALSLIGDLRSTAGTQLTKQMNVEVRRALVAAKALGDAVTAESSQDDIFAAIGALNQATTEAEASIAVYEAIKARLDLLTSDSQRGSIPTASMQAATFYDNYKNGDLENTGTYTDETPKQVTELYQEFVASYWNANAPAPNADLTAFVLNQGFEFGDLTGWTASQHNGGSYIQEESASDGGKYVSNHWTNNYAYVNLSKTVTGLPNGTYKVKASFRSSRPNLTLTLNSSDTEFTTVSEDYQQFEGTGIVADGTLTITVTSRKQDGIAYFRSDDFRLIFLSNQLTDDMFDAIELPTGQMNQTAKEEMVNAYQALSDEHSVENYNTLQEKLEAAQQSVAVYQQINTYLTYLGTPSQLGDIALATFQAADIYKKYRNGQVNGSADDATGTYTSLDEVLPLWKELVTTYWQSQTLEGDEDLTAYVVNQGFELDRERINEPTGWEVPNRGTDRGVFSTTGSYAMSNSEGDRLFNNYEDANKKRDLRQVLQGLPSGTYRISAIVAGWDTSKQCHEVTMTANGYENSIQTTGAGNGLELTLETFVTSNGTLTLTIMANMAGVGELSAEKRGTLFKADNIRLTYVSETASEELISRITLPTGQMNQDVKQAMKDAYSTFQTNASSANYEALTNRITEAERSIAVYDDINARLDLLRADSQRGDIPVASINAAAVVANYSNGRVDGAADATTGTYTSLDEVLPLWKTFVSEYWAANKTANKDMTAFIINQGFEFGINNTTGWIISKPSTDTNIHTNTGTYKATGGEGTYLFYTVWQGVPLRQEITGLPNGTYRLSAKLASGEAEKKGYVFLTANTEQEGFEFEAGTWGELSTKTLEFVVADGKANIRIVGGRDDGSFDAAGYWRYKADDVRLTFLGSDVLLEIPDMVEGDLMHKRTYEAQNAAYTAWNAADGHTPANYVACVETQAEAVKSHAAYVEAQRTLQEVLDFLASTNVYTYEAYNNFNGVYDSYNTLFTERTMEDTDAAGLYARFFGNHGLHQTGLPVIPFLGSAWDDAGDYTWGKGSDLRSGDENYWVNTWSQEGETDGSNFAVPFMEYWRANGTNLPGNTLTAEIKATPEAEYVVTALVRIRTNDGNEPTGITLHVRQEGSNDALLHDYVNDTPTWEQVEGTNFFIATMRVSGYADTDSDGDGYGDLRMQFVVDGENTNASWLCFKNVLATFSGTMSTQTITNLLNGLKEEIDLANSKTLGFEQDEYAPYTNVEQLVALQNAEGYYTLLNRLYTEYQNGDRAWSELTAGINYLLMKHAWDELKQANLSWTKNTEEEMNAFFWTDNYTTGDVEDIWVYNEDGTMPANPFKGILPSGWDLDGRSDSYNTRIQKYHVNTEAVGITAINDETGLFVKYNTNYGKQTGYTMPLKKGTKYSISFTYATWGDWKDIRTRVKMYKKDSPNEFVDVFETRDDDDLRNYFDVSRDEHGDEDPTIWNMFRGYFTTDSDEDQEYVIVIEKDRDYRRNLGFQGFLTEQLQIMLGELYLVKYGDITDNIDGESTDFTYEYEANLKARNVKLKRTFSNTAWNSLVLPFKLTYKEMKNTFGVEKAYYYVGTHKVGNLANLCFEGRKNGIQANTPVLISKEATSYGEGNEKTFRNIVIKEKSDLTVKDNVNDLYYLVGTFGTIRIPEHDVYIGNDNTIKKSKGKTGLKATRAYFHDVHRGESEVKLVGFSLDDIETGIMAIEEDGSMTVTSGNIYTLDGKLVRSNAKSLRGLAPGIYVVDGRKVSIK